MPQASSSDAPPSTSSARVLVTGARGFTGSPLLQALEQRGYTVIATGLQADDRGTEALDIASEASCAEVIGKWKPDYIVNLAAFSFIQHEDPTDFYRSNTIGVTNLLSAVARADYPIRKILLASSANVYGNTGGALINESQALAPANHYGASKMAMEKMAATYFDRLPIIITRPFNYTGVGQDPSFLVPKIVSHFARGARVIELGNIDVERDFSDVRVVADIYRRLMECEARSTVLNICTGVATSLRRVIELMQDVAGYTIEVRVNPAFVRSNDIRQLTGDPTALIGAIGPLHQIPLRDTLAAMYEALRRGNPA